MLGRRSFFKRCAFLAAGLVASRYMPLVDLVVPKTPKVGVGWKVIHKWESGILGGAPAKLTEVILNEYYVKTFDKWKPFRAEVLLPDGSKEIWS